MIPLLLLVLAGGTGGLHAGPPAAAPELLLGSRYPLEVSAPFHAALLHWMDSLTNLSGHGMTAGKTVTAHRRSYPAPSDEDLRMLGLYREARLAHARAVGQASRDLPVLAFFESADLAEALRRMDELMAPPQARDLALALRHFAPRYRSVWDGGRIPGEFLERARGTARRERLAGFLERVARFYGVAPGGPPHPHLVLVPVDHGFGTHAQAIGRFLLVEVRPGEGLTEEVAPIVHENAHFLFSRMGPARLEQLRATALEAGPHGAAAWQLLAEALPTAIAQGVAARRFGPTGWTRNEPWYHRPEIDAYAKRLFPLVRRTLAGQGRLDADFVRLALEAYAAG